MFIFDVFAYKYCLVFTCGVVYLLNLHSMENLENKLIGTRRFCATVRVKLLSVCVKKITGMYLGLLLIHFRFYCHYAHPHVAFGRLR